MRTHRRHDPGRDGSVPLVFVGKTVVGMQFSSDPHGDADYHGGYLYEIMTNNSLLSRKSLKLRDSISLKPTEIPARRAIPTGAPTRVPS